MNRYEVEFMARAIVRFKVPVVAERAEEAAILAVQESPESCLLVSTLGAPIVVEVKKLWQSSYCNLKEPVPSISASQTPRKS